MGGGCLPGIAKLPSSALGGYAGLLTLNATEVLNTSGTATIEESSCKTYTISFSDNVPSVSDIRFIMPDGDDSFTYVNTNATITVNINSEGMLTVVKSNAPVITFSGEK